jgi:hypothetical protein
MEEINQKMEAENPSSDILREEIEIYQKYQQVLRKEEGEWRLKSQNLWLEYGDCNTAFFHK